jgi:DNA-directed RNA polymerase specialized sigma24 family protein
MKTVEISNLLDISEAAVRKRLERARDILKKKMEAYNG